ncbi:uncharacterized protein LOC126374881 [Pectinophora gossypiella]|uniref:Myb/SANT-like DNA-binding domain-containing protein n=1 Tax=Pectinophora gossypiella TaxID=13191 RepID=A0A1E1WEW9_PECGO|nr:uncharacterized protein LOC126374881 [Pectinophora gossypiella]
MTATELEYIDADAEYIQLDRTETLETEMQDDNDDNWDSKNITTMLNLYLQNLDKFRNPKVRKKNLWIDIGAAVGKTPDSCDKKFRNLKQTYLRLLKKKNTDGCSHIKWPYFNIYDQIYCVDGEYQPEIQQKILEVSNEGVVAKALLSIRSGTTYATELSENGHSSNPTDEERKKVTKKRYAELKRVTLEMRDRQRMVEEKLDRLINIVEESNSIQRERNALFEQFLEKLNQNR